MPLHPIAYIYTCTKLAGKKNGNEQFSQNVIQCIFLRGTTIISHGDGCKYMYMYMHVHVLS